MAARSISSLTLSFGLVAIPVKLYSATEPGKQLSFNLLHKDCGSRLKQKYFCAKEQIPVTRAEMVSGYEFAKDQYVIFTPEELKSFEEAGTHAAEITEFLPISAIDPVYFDKAYYLAPDKGGTKPYALLARAMKASKKCAIGRWAARGKQYIVLIRPSGDGLVMQQLMHAEEVRSINDIDIPKVEVKETELKLAQQLIEQQSVEKFDPTAYKDDVRERVEAAIKQKIEGKEVTMTEAPEGQSAQVIDLMEALRASLEKKGLTPSMKGPAKAGGKTPDAANESAANGAGKGHDADVDADEAAAAHEAAGDSRPARKPPRRAQGAGSAAAATAATEPAPRRSARK